MQSPPIRHTPMGTVVGMGPAHAVSGQKRVNLEGRITNSAAGCALVSK